MECIQIARSFPNNFQQIQSRWNKLPQILSLTLILQTLKKGTSVVSTYLSSDIHFCLNGKTGIWWQLREAKKDLDNGHIGKKFQVYLRENYRRIMHFSVKLGIIISSGLPQNGLSSNALQGLYIAHIHYCLFFFLLALFYFSACRNRIIETWALSYN